MDVHGDVVRRRDTADCEGSTQFIALAFCGVSEHWSMPLRGAWIRPPSALSAKVARMGQIGRRPVHPICATWWLGSLVDAALETGDA